MKQSIQAFFSNIPLSRFPMTSMLPKSIVNSQNQCLIDIWHSYRLPLSLISFFTWVVRYHSFNFPPTTLASFQLIFGPQLTMGNWNHRSKTEDKGGILYNVIWKTMCSYYILTLKLILSSILVVGIIFYKEFLGEAFLTIFIYLFGWVNVSEVRYMKCYYFYVGFLAL